VPSIRSTYRVQLRPEFTLDDAAAIADYLAALGVSHLYSSPQLQASPGSTHGYDVVDHSSLNAELGGMDGNRRLQAALGEAGLGMVLDIVPNHMAITGPENRWWWDVLENGPSSRYASYFDVEWDPPESYLRNKVLLPVLGDHYGRVLENGELRLVRDSSWFAVRYHEQAFPVAPRSADGLLRAASERSGSDDLGFIADALARLPPATATDRAAAWRRARDVEVLRRQLARLTGERPDIATAIDHVVEEINATPDALDALLEAQNYRLALWRAARRDLGYRRFFGVNTLVGLRQEDEIVFADTHRTVFRMLAAGAIDGLRVDHPDGLRDPAAYFHRLRENAPTAWITAEKILEPGEELRDDWEVDGTTGYDFLNMVGGLFVDPAGEHPLTELYAELTGRRVDFHEEVRQKKELVLNEELGSDLNRLTQLFLDVAERHRRHRDYTRDELHGGLRTVISCMPVYRTYVVAETGSVSRDDERWIRDAVALARERRADLDPGLFEFLEGILLLRVTGSLETELVMRFQQLTGPAMAKGAEDTAFFTYNRLAALNEVGGDPGRFGVSPFEFHAFAQRRAERWPRTMNTTSTHDTKRGEDVRTRIAALSEIPDAWASTVRRWRDTNAGYRSAAGLGAPTAPDPDTEYLLYQTLVGAWPIKTDRLEAYLQKAMREAKVQTSWSAPNEAFERGVHEFTRAILRDDRFCHELETFLRPIVAAARISSLSQLLLKLTSPGIPDVYQGTEVWDLSLVDPDNRRPVDYAARRALLSFVASAGPAEVMARMDEGAPKAWLFHRVLAFRNERPELFGPGSEYRPLEAQGPRATNVIAFARGGRAVAVAPRLTLSLGDPPDWRGTRLALPAGRWRDVLSGGSASSGVVDVAALLREFPVALLVAEDSARS
jgi:(1->4)-alpha-D-glucan 1-alpha-D-glucosylmutase